MLQYYTTLNWYRETDQAV